MPDPAACLLLSEALSVSPVTAQVLYNRGLTTPESAHLFLGAGRSQILDPFLLKDMDRAVALLKARIASGKPLMVYGDYDVDGVTGTTILVLALRALGAQVDYYIPDRFTEGYGLNSAALQEIYSRGYDFVLSVDTGTTAIPEAMVARELGMTLVISDHHEPGPELPEVGALINPKRPDCLYPFKGLSGVGVAFKLALALESPGAWDLLDIVTMGTIADMVPLIGENRAIVREGLAALGTTARPGLRALMEVAGVRQPVTATHIGFAIGPRINALGRMGSAMQGVELLLTTDPERAARLAHHLDEQNRRRQEVEAEILKEALAQAEQQRPEEREFVLVLAGKDWHHGVVGICASRVLEAYHRPTILLSTLGEKARGSARSIPAFHMHRALIQVSDLFAKFGGHAAAAGMTLHRAEDVGELRRRLNAIGSQWLQPQDLVPELEVDAFIGLEQVTPDLVAELQKLEPHGMGNPNPVLGVRGARVADARVIGKEQQHVKLSVTCAGLRQSLDALGWNMAAVRPPANSALDLAFKPEIETFQGRASLRLTLKDFKVHGEPLGTGPRASGVLPGAADHPDAEPPLPGLPTLESCLRWDPLAGLGRPARSRPSSVVDARGERLPAILAQLNRPLAEIAAGSEGGTGEEESPDLDRLSYLVALSAPAGSRVLVLTGSPWAAATLADQLRRAGLMGQVRLWQPGESEPAELPGELIVVAPFGVEPQAAYTDIALYHPPYHLGQVPAGRVHLLWHETDWALTQAALGWPYPDRGVLVHLFKLLKAAVGAAAGAGPAVGAAGSGSGKGAGPEQLAKALREIPGPWNHLRWEAGLTIFREMGLLGAGGELEASGAKFDLESSIRYRRGVAGRSAAALSQANDWPRVS